MAPTCDWQKGGRNRSGKTRPARQVWTGPAHAPFSRGKCQQILGLQLRETREGGLLPYATTELGAGF